MNLNDFKRLVSPLGRKIFLLLGRALLQAINNSENTQKIQVTALDGENISGMERFQEYGLEAYPFSGAEVAVIFLNGNRDHGIALCIHDRRYRPKDLVEGEVALYTDEDKTTPFRVHLKRNRIFFVQADKEDVTFDTSKTVTSPTETHNNATEHIIDSPQISLGGANFGALRTLIDSRFIALFNAHVHGGITPGAANSSFPTTTMVEVDHATSRVKGI